MKHFVNLARVPPSHHARIWTTVRRRLVRMLSRDQHAAMEQARLHLVVHPADRAPGGWTARLRIQIEDTLLTFVIARDVHQRGEAEDWPGWSALAIDDLVDETLVRAWEGFDARPDRVSVDVWLRGILDRVVDEQCAESLACEPLEDADEAAGDEDLPDEPACWQVAREDPPGVALWEDREQHPGIAGRAVRCERDAPIRRGTL